MSKDLNRAIFGIKCMLDELNDYEYVLNNYLNGPDYYKSEYHDNVCMGLNKPENWKLKHDIKRLHALTNDMIIVIENLPSVDASKKYYTKD